MEGKREKYLRDYFMVEEMNEEEDEEGYSVVSTGS